MENLYALHLERQKKRPETARKGPKFRLGTIKSKYLIVDIMSMACSYGDTLLYLGHSCKQLRQLLIQNFALVRSQTHALGNILAIDLAQLTSPNGTSITVGGHSFRQSVQLTVTSQEQMEAALYLLGERRT